ncbi:MAG: M67 family metallopeptidase [Gammaproteobacteria bacterium]|nr:M67 family metallopeptidase [Gammaproteobacteria bacterium]MCF6362314.1 M67 family metallopeptidase [Gammaproteobacteria bacterium]
MSHIHFPRPLINQILQQAQQAEDSEVCGLVSARGGQPVHCYPVANAAEKPAHRFRMHPQQQIEAMRQIREQGEELFAIYHSHPHTPAQPSATDLREATYPDTLYIIISLATEGTLEMRGFRLKSGNIEDVDLVVD